MPDLNQWRDDLHATAKEKGWWDTSLLTGVFDNVNIPEKLALIHSEISEALEDYRNGDMSVYLEDSHTDLPGPYKPTGFSIELADAIIRILDLCGYLNIDIEAAVRQKADYNKSRPYRHGGKKA